MQLLPSSQFFFSVITASWKPWLCNLSCHCFSKAPTKSVKLLTMSTFSVSVCSGSLITFHFINIFVNFIRKICRPKSSKVASHLVGGSRLMTAVSFCFCASNTPPPPPPSSVERCCATLLTSTSYSMELVVYNHFLYLSVRSGWFPRG